MTEKYIISYIIYMKILDKSYNYEELFSTYNKAIILGKGPTFKPVTSRHEKTFVICVNDTINSSEIYDMLVINDIETWDRIDDKKLKNLNYILSPVYPHYNCIPDYKTTNIKKVLKILSEKGFNGNIIFYNLLTSELEDESFFNLPSALSGSNTGVDFITLFMKNVNCIEFFGVCKGNGYNKKFNDVLSVSNQYNNERLDQLKEHIVYSCKEYNINVTFN
jgi:hypothetical protein